MMEKENSSTPVKKTKCPQARRITTTTTDPPQTLFTLSSPQKNTKRNPKVLKEQTALRVPYSSRTVPLHNALGPT